MTNVLHKPDMFGWKLQPRHLEDCRKLICFCSCFVMFMFCDALMYISCRAHCARIVVILIGAHLDISSLYRPAYLAVHFLHGQKWKLLVICFDYKRTNQKQDGAKKLAIAIIVIADTCINHIPTQVASTFVTSLFQALWYSLLKIWCTSLFFRHHTVMLWICFHLDQWQAYGPGTF